MTPHDPRARGGTMRNPFDHGPGWIARVLPGITIVLLFVIVGTDSHAQSAGTPDTLAAGRPDTLHFEPVPAVEDVFENEYDPDRSHSWERAWLQDPFHRHLLSHGRHVV